MKITAKYAIRKTRNFYGPMTEHSLVMSDYSASALIFATEEDAKECIKKLNISVYWLSYNESGRPKYKAINTARLPDYFIAQL